MRDGGNPPDGSAVNVNVVVEELVAVSDGAAGLLLHDPPSSVAKPRHMRSGRMRDVFPDMIDRGRGVCAPQLVYRREGPKTLGHGELRVSRVTELVQAEAEQSGASSRQ